MCECILVSMHIRMYVRKYISPFKYLMSNTPCQISPSPYMCADHVYPDAHAHTCTYTHICTHTCTHTYIRTYTYIRAHTHTRTHTHTHTHIQAELSAKEELAEKYQQMLQDIRKEHQVEVSALKEEAATLRLKLNTQADSAFSRLKQVAMEAATISTPEGPTDAQLERLLKLEDLTIQQQQEVNRLRQEVRCWLPTLRLSSCYVLRTYVHLCTYV